jgi:hypothetical protein
MMNSKTTNQPRKGDNMTISQHVSASPDFVQLEQSNQIFEHSKCSDSFDPIIAAYDFRWNKLFVKPLSQVEGMAYGVREDLLTGRYMPWSNHRQPMPCHQFDSSLFLGLC